MVSKSVWSAVFFWPISLLMLGCGNASSNLITPPAQKAAFLYATTLVGTPPNQTLQLSTYKVDAATGALNSTGAVPLSQLATGMAVDPASRFLYLSDQVAGSGFIDVFAINPATGSVSQVSLFPTTTICPFCPPANGPGPLAITPGGRFLYYGSFSLGVTETIGALSIDSMTGALNAVVGSPFPADQAPFEVVVHPSGKFLYTENTDGSALQGLLATTVSQFSVDATTGVITPVQGSPFPVATTGDLSGFGLDPSGRFLYATTGRVANGILGWSVDGTTGALTPLSGSPFASGASTFKLAFHPSGGFVYTSGGPSGGVLGFAIGPTGALSPLSGSPFFSSSVVAQPVVDPSGRFLFAVDLTNKAIAAYTIDNATGVLTSSGLTGQVVGPASLLVVQAP